MYNRSREHVKDLKNNDKKSAFEKHIIEEHPDEKNEVDFDVILTGTFNKPTERLINEGIRIKNHEKNTLLNSKSEYHGPSVKRRTVEGKTEHCYQCNFKSKSEACMKKHKMYEHVKKNEFNCKICQETFENIAQLHMHKKRSMPKLI